jgi:hypothetical protein
VPKLVHSPLIWRFVIACGVQNSAICLDLGFYAARSYSLMRPPRCRIEDQRSTCGCRKPVPPGGTHESRLRHGLPLDPQLIQADDAIGQLTSHAQSGTVSGTCFAVRVPHGSLPFPPPPQPCSAGPQVLRSDPTAVPVHPRLTASAFGGPPPADQADGPARALRFSRMKVPYMPWFSDRAEPASGSR